MEPLSVTFPVDLPLARASYRACHRRAYLLRWGLLLALVLGGLLARLPELVVAGVAGLVVGEVSVRRQLRSYRSGVRDVTVTCTEEEYRTQAGDRRTARSWSTFASVRRVGRFWVLRTPSSGALAFPADVLDAGQTAAFEELVTRKGLLAA